MYIDIQPSTLTGRGYDTIDGYERREPYRLVFSVSLIGNGEAYMYAMNGTQVTLNVIGKIAQELYTKYGVTTLIAERNNRRITYNLKRVMERALALK